MGDNRLHQTRRPNLGRLAKRNIEENELTQPKKSSTQLTAVGKDTDSGRRREERVATQKE
jgi:hypothetical protein